MRFRLFFAFFVVLPHTFVTAVKAGQESGSSLEALNELSHTYREIVDHLKTYTLPEAPVARFDLSSYSPFCSNVTIPEANEMIEAECLRWEEQELDMLLMYIDLIAVGMRRSLAEEFYKQIRCWSRKNIKPVPKLLAWQVCFKYDYSEVVGTLLAYYVSQDFEMKSRADASLIPASRFLFGSFPRVTDKNRGQFLLGVFNDATSYRLYGNEMERKVQTSCCEKCMKNYFVNVERSQCLKNPFGKHCCHKACKSLGRLKIGVSSSVRYCCQKCRPLRCQR